MLRILIVSSDLSKHSTVPIPAAAGLMRMCLKNIPVGVQSAWMYQVCKLICNSSHEPRLGSRPRGDKINWLGNIYSKFNKKQREARWLISFAFISRKVIWRISLCGLCISSVCILRREAVMHILSLNSFFTGRLRERTACTVTHQRSAEITPRRWEPSLRKMSVMRVEFHTTETRKNNFISGSWRLMRTC